MPIVCSSCGKKLRARAELSGKRVKCPQCGQVVLLPSGSKTTPPNVPSSPASSSMPGTAAPDKKPVDSETTPVEKVKESEKDDGMFGSNKVQ